MMEVKLYDGDMCTINPTAITAFRASHKDGGYTTTRETTIVYVQGYFSFQVDMPYEEFKTYYNKAMYQ